MEKLSTFLDYPVHLEGRLLNNKCRADSRLDDVSAMESHGAREILYIVQGAYDFLLNGNIYHLEPGDCCFVNKWVPHQKEYKGNGKNMLHQWIYLHPDHCNSVLVKINENGELEYDNFVALSPKLAPYLNDLWDLAMSLPPDAQETRQLYASIASRSLEDTLLWENINKNTGAPKINIVAYIKNYINITNGNGVTLKKLEGLTGYNRFYIARIFKNENNMTIHEYIDCVRRGFIRHAEDNHMSQKEISVALGFSSPTAFWLWKNRDQKK